MTLCNMVVEAGGKNGVVPADSTTFKYLEGKATVPYQPIASVLRCQAQLELTLKLCLSDRSTFWRA